MKKLIIPVLICILFLCSCSKKSEINGFSMDAVYSVKINGITHEKKTEIKDILNSADGLFNAYGGSVLYTLNTEKKLEYKKDYEMLFEIIESSLPYCNEYFDIAIRPFTKLWNFSDDNPIPPHDEEIEAKKASVGNNNILYSDKKIILENNCEIELGALAKGYICDKIYEISKDYEGLFDIGGTIKSSYNKPVSVGIRNPKGGILCSFDIKKGESVSTSGIYERNFTYEGKTYHHILDPKTGKSVFNDLLSVTVVCDSALEADILSTTYFVSGIDNTSPQDNTTVIFVKKNGEIIQKGLKRKIRLTQ